MISTSIRGLVVADATAPLITALQLDADIEVVRRVATAAEAVAAVSSDHPDIVILDLNLTAGDTRGAIRSIMDRAPTPILVLSARLQDRRSSLVMQALAAGAADALASPRDWDGEPGVALREQVRRLSSVRVHRRPPTGGEPHHPGRGVHVGHAPVVAIAASTGGPSALAALLAQLGGLAAPVLIVQHLHAEFTDGLVEWMSRVSALPVEVARDAQHAEPGRVYIAPGGTHLRLGPRLRLALGLDPVSLHRPSADALFASVAEHAGSAGVGVVLTGMGEDGAEGLLQMRRRGGRTLAQDEASCAVFGMPRAAQRLGAVDQMLPLSKIAAAIQHAVSAVRV
jgi:two-component system, chemotaxis family, protein-glutamate methylesterase/glutaminase